MRALRGIALPIALTLLSGCRAPVGHLAVAGEREDPTLDEAALSSSNLPEAARSRLDAERIEVVDNEKGYAFRDVLGEVTEDAFVRRYREVTGETDIDRDRHALPGTALVATGGLAMAAGFIGGLVLLVSTSQSSPNCSQTPQGQFCFNQGDSVQPAAVVGGIGLATVGIVGAGLLFEGLKANKGRHGLSRADAERYTDRYNRSLLRNLLRPTESTPPRDPPAPPAPSSGDVSAPDRR